MTRPEEVIGEALTAHQIAQADEHDYCSLCGLEYTYASHAYHPTHQARAVIEAIRAMSPDEQAELIDGEVEQANLGKYAHDPIQARVVGPWVEVSDV